MFSKTHFGFHRSGWPLGIALVVSLATGIWKAKAQCAHNPTVTPNNLIFCPSGSSDTLWTQSYQAYQWYKDGVLQAGDTLRYRRVTSLDAGSMFSVDATLNGCTERSPQVMVDGWVFLPPVVTTDGLRFPLCIGDTLWLRLLSPYGINIQWTNGGVPIPGATDDTLIVTTDGNYSVSGAPEICPNFIQQLGVVLSYRFVPCGASSDPWKADSEENLSSYRMTFGVYPNPSAGTNLFLKGNPEFENGVLEVYDARGQSILKIPVTHHESHSSWPEIRESLGQGIRVEFPYDPCEGFYTLIWRSHSGKWSTRWGITR